MDDWELELWAVWEATYGPLGQRRTDALIASLAQAMLMPHTKQVPDLETLIPFKVRDWDEEATAEAAQARVHDDDADGSHRAGQAAVSNAAQGKAAGGLGKETGPNGEWFGPITDAPPLPQA